MYVIQTLTNKCKIAAVAILKCYKGDVIVLGKVRIETFDSHGKMRESILNEETIGLESENGVGLTS